MKSLVLPFVILGVLASGCSSTDASSSVAHTSPPTQANTRQTFVVDCKESNWYSSAASCVKVSNCLAARLPNDRFREANYATVARTPIDSSTSRVLAVCKAQGFTGSEATRLQQGYVLECATESGLGSLGGSSCSRVWTCLTNRLTLKQLANPGPISVQMWLADHACAQQRCSKGGVGACISPLPATSSSSPSASSNSAPASQSKPTVNAFAGTAGWVTLSGRPIVMFNPADPRQVRTLGFAPYGNAVAWSRDGKMLLVSTADQRLVIVKDDKRHAVIAHGAQGNGSFTPDGRYVIYSDGHNIYRVSVDGKHRTVLARGMYALSQDAGDQLDETGNALIFERYNYGDGGNGFSLLNPRNGGRIRVLANQDATGKNGYQDAHNVDPLTWIPGTGSFLVVASNDSRSHCAVYRVGVSRGPRKPLGSSTTWAAMDRWRWPVQRWGPPGFCPARASSGANSDTIAFTGAKPDRIVLTDLEGHVVSVTRYPPGMAVHSLYLTRSPSVA